MNPYSKLSYPYLDTIKDEFFRLVGNYSDFPDQKKQAVTVDISKSLGKYITKEV